MRGESKYKLFGVDICLKCGSPNVETHHIFYGTANRKHSDRFGYIAPLCREHHTGNSGVHFDKDFDLQLKQFAEADFLKHHGSVDDFRRIFGKSYL